MGLKSWGEICFESAKCTIQFFKKQEADNDDDNDRYLESVTCIKGKCSRNM